VKSIIKRVERFWAEDRSLSVLLVILLVQIFFVIQFGQTNLFWKIIFSALYIFLLAVGLLYITHTHKFAVTLFLALASAVMLCAVILTNAVWVDLLTDVFIVLYCLLLGWIVLMRTFSEGPITHHRILGSIVSYLLIGLVFSNLYHIIYLCVGKDAFRGLGSSDNKEFMYFSITTLATLGYGDITPAIPLTRSLSNLEGLIGQLYPAILITRIVSMQIEYYKKA